MKKLVCLLVVLSPLFVHAQNNTLNQAVDRAVTAQTSFVKVWVKLAKPVYMSEVMFRRPRCKDTVIRIDYKELECTGRLSAQKTHVWVPASCVKDGKYNASRIKMTFADGSSIQKSAEAVQTVGQQARIGI